MNQKLRHIFLAMHFYVGISLGLIFVLAGITGSALAFYVEIDRTLNPELVLSKYKGLSPLPQSYEAIYHALEKQFPDRNHSWRFEIPSDKSRPLLARYYKPIEKKQYEFAPLIVAINPYTLEIINARFWGDYVMTWIYDLHYTLLLESFGKTVMFFLGIIFFMTLLLGIYLWLPRTGKWKQALSIRVRSGNKRKNYDIHTIAGIYGLVLTTTILITGIFLIKPSWTNPIVNQISTIRSVPVLFSDTSKGERITVDQALNIAQRQYKSASARWIETPDGASGVYSIRLKLSGEPGDRFPKTQVWIDQYSGEILESWSGLNRAKGQIFLDWLHPLHSGEGFGLLGRLLVLISGFIPLILWVTGIIRWIQKKSD